MPEENKPEIDFIEGNSWGTREIKVVAKNGFGVLLLSQGLSNNITFSMRFKKNLNTF